MVSELNNCVLYTTFFKRLIKLQSASNVLEIYLVALHTAWLALVYENSSSYCFTSAVAFKL